MKDPLPRTTNSMNSQKAKSSGDLQQTRTLKAQDRTATASATAGRKSQNRHSKNNPDSKRTKKNSNQGSEDLGFLDSLKSEWNLFWENIVGDDAETESREAEKKLANEESQKDPFSTGKLERLSFEQIKAITKVLSQDRAQLNQKLEKINREIEENMAKAQSLSLVGGDVEEAQAKTSELNELGQQIAAELGKLDEQLKLTRRREDALKKSLKKLEL